VRLGLMAILIGVCTVALELTTLYVDNPSSILWVDELPIIIIQIGFVAAPFLILAAMGESQKTPWLLGLGLTFSLWGFYLYDGLSRRGDGTGVNLGLVLVMLVSPILISIACVSVALRHRRGV
jgi:hypothetical protein